MAAKLTTKTCPACNGSGSVPGDDVGPLLRGEREKAGIQRKQMADAIGISDSYLYDLELGNRRWTNEVMTAFQRVLAEGVGA